MSSEVFASPTPSVPLLDRLGTVDPRMNRFMELGIPVRMALRPYAGEQPRDGKIIQHMPFQVDDTDLKGDIRVVGDIEGSSRTFGLQVQLDHVPQRLRERVYAVVRSADSRTEWHSAPATSTESPTYVRRILRDDRTWTAAGREASLDRWKITTKTNGLTLMHGLPVGLFTDSPENRAMLENGTIEIRLR